MCDVFGSCTIKEGGVFPAYLKKMLWSKFSLTKTIWKYLLPHILANVIHFRSINFIISFSCFVSQYFFREHLSLKKKIPFIWSIHALSFPEVSKVHMVCLLDPEKRSLSLNSPSLIVLYRNETKYLISAYNKVSIDLLIPFSLFEICKKLSQEL